MAAVWEAWLDRLVPVEGGYSNDPADAGGETNWGITVAVARRNGYSGSMRAMTLDQAKTIYRADYIVKPQFDQLAAIDNGLAWKLFDIGVNAGQATGGKMLQRALNVLNNGGADFPDLVVDGGCGEMTRTALRAFLAKRGHDGRQVLIAMICGQQCVKYIEIAEAKPTQERFEYGWQLGRAMAQPV